LIFFFIHRFNDIDHITPIIYRISKDTNYKIKVWCLNPFYDISKDYRLVFLKSSLKIDVEYFFKGFSSSLFHTIFSFLLCKKTGKKLSSVIAIFSQKFNLFNKLIFHLIYGEKWVEKLFEKYRPNLLVLDNTAAASSVYNMKSINKIAKKQIIPKISLPHGVPLFTKHPKSYDNAKRGLFNNDCEKIILPSKRWMKECVEFGVPSEKLDVIGVARHCKEWEEILQKIVPWNKWLDLKGQNKLKVVYMDMGPDRYHKFKKIAEDTISLINGIDFVHLLYKPHTRSNIANLKIPSGVEIVTNINSHNLIKWSDVVIGMSSSIILGVLMQKKTYISPTFFREIKMVHEEYGASWMVKDHNELIKALNTIYKNPNYEACSKESIDKFLTEIVYAGKKDHDVLGHYKDLLCSYL
jgi:hypothetical protein